MLKTTKTIVVIVISKFVTFYCLKFEKKIYFYFLLVIV